jgi:hypothetical protein
VTESNINTLVQSAAICLSIIGCATAFSMCSMSKQANVSAEVIAVETTKQRQVEAQMERTRLERFTAEGIIKAGEARRAESERKQ